MSRAREKKVLGHRGISGLRMITRERGSFTRSGNERRAE